MACGRTYYNRPLFPGTFDPITNGHIWVVSRAINSDLFEKVIVAVTERPGYAPLFPREQRLALWKEIALGLHPERVEVVGLEQKCAVTYAAERNCRFLLRGTPSLQNWGDEQALQKLNHDLEPMVQPVYLLPDPEVAGISSRVVRDLIGREGWREAVKKYISVGTWEALMEKVIRKELR